MKVDMLARILHECGRSAVLQQLTVNKPCGPFLEWHELTPEAQHGRRLQAETLLIHCDVRLRTDAAREPAEGAQ